MPTDFTGTAAEALQAIGTRIQNEKRIFVAILPQSDMALMWKGVLVHPVQQLQNVHQQLAAAAVRAAVGDEAKRAEESKVLNAYFAFDASAPRILPPDDPPLDPEGRLATGQAKLRDLKTELANAPGNAAAIALSADAVADELLAIVGTFNHQPTAVPLLDRALAEIALAKTEAGNGRAAQAIKHGAKAVTHIEEALTGYCAIQMIHLIAPFYLFRLLVRFQLQSDAPITAGVRAGVSGALTGLLNNNPAGIRQWLFDFLAARIIQLETALMALDPDRVNILFFLKGGRALKYLEDDRLNGENDWDTQVVINPELPLNEWYELLRKVHNVVVDKLRQFKREFFVLLHATPGFLADVQGLDPVAAFVPPAARAEISNTKAELIDIGIPRVDTVEAFEQWEKMHGKVEHRHDVPLPPFLYYIDEYVLMIREAFGNVSISVGKTPKRMTRLNGIIAREELAEVVAHERERIPGNLPKCLELLDDGGTAEAMKRILTLVFRQFATAFDMKRDPSVAAYFDGLVEAAKADIRRKVAAVVPESLRNAIAAPGVVFGGAEQTIHDSVGLGHMLSTLMEQMQKSRGEFLARPDVRPKIGAFIKALYTAGVFTQSDELQVQFAVTGSFAARLHAEYARFPRMNEIEPLDCFEVTLFCSDPNILATAVRDAIILPAIERFVRNPNTVRLTYELLEDEGAPVLLFWPVEVQMGDAMFKPRVVSIRVETRPKRWPQLSFIWGYPVLALRDLIREYHRKIAHLDEFGTQQRLRSTAAALVDILTDHENRASEKPPVPEERQQPGVVLPQLPAVEIRNVVPDVPRIAQENGNWCWAAASTMMRRFYLAEGIDLHGVVRQALGNEENRTWSLSLGRLDPGRVEGTLLSWAQIRREIDEGHPFIIANGPHYRVCVGYSEGAEGNRLLCYDPIVPGDGPVPYDEYVRNVQAGGGTAYNFRRNPKTVRVPLTVSSNVYDGSAPITVRYSIANLRPCLAQLIVRDRENALGEEGAVLTRIPLADDTNMAWSGDRGGHDESQDLLLQIEATLVDGNEADPVALENGVLSAPVVVIVAQVAVHMEPVNEGGPPGEDQVRPDVKRSVDGIGERADGRESPKRRAQSNDANQEEDDEL